MSINRLKIEDLGIFEASVVAKKYKGNMSSMSVTIPLTISKSYNVEKGDIVKLAILAVKKKEDSLLSTPPRVSDTHTERTHARASLEETAQETSDLFLATSEAANRNE